jgi:hypothetical protein
MNNAVIAQSFPSRRTVSDTRLGNGFGKDLVKTLAMRGLRAYNMAEELIRRKPVLFQNLQHRRNATAMPGDGTQARLRAW